LKITRIIKMEKESLRDDLTKYLPSWR